MEVTIQPFGTWRKQSFDEIVITTTAGARVSFTDFGARINQFAVPTADGRLEQIILGHQDVQDATVFRSCYGATIGRVSGRIAEGTFTISDIDYHVPCNLPPHHLHGGEGYDLQKWDYSITEKADEVAITFRYVDAAFANGFPGTVTVEVTHTVTEQLAWTVHYRAETTAATPFNPTNHVYFNLNGNQKQPVTNHTLWVRASHYLPLDSTGIPTGEVRAVQGSAFDLREAKRFDAVLRLPDEQLQACNGYDHPFVIDEASPDDPVAVIHCEDTKRQVRVYSDRSHLVMFTHNGVDLPFEVWGHPLQVHAGVALETQAAPDAINQPHLGETILLPGDVFDSYTRYQFDQLL